MIFILICTTLLLIVPIIVGYRVWDGFDLFEGLVAWLLSLLTGMAISLALLVVISLIQESINTETYKRKRTEQIVSLNDGTGIKGNINGGIFLVRGSIEDTQNFSYYRELKDGSFELKKRPADKSKIFTDTTSDKARVDLTEKVERCDVKASWINLGCDMKEVTLVQARFHVPKGSITEEYRLDAK